MPDIHPSLYFEELLWKDGCKWVGGIDEAIEKAKKLASS